MTDRLKRQLAFIHEIDKLKYVLRKTKLFNSDRHENDAEHSWHLTMMVLVLAEYANESVDVLKVLKMIIIHDLVEIYAGDTFLFDSNKDHKNTEEELVAAKRIFGFLPQDQADEYLSLWEEFEAFETNEARFARSIDHLEPILQNVSNEGGTWKEFDVPHGVVHQKKSVIKEGSSSIWAYVEQLLEESVNNGILKR